MLSITSTTLTREELQTMIAQLRKSLAELFQSKAEVATMMSNPLIVLHSGVSITTTLLFIDDKIKHGLEVLNKAQQMYQDLEHAK